jgi:hypothetical protein
MELFDKVRRHENLHIVFWLIKDSCWMLEIKWLGALMVGPALFMAGWIVYITRKSYEVYLNIAIFFWITANSFWMIIEFFFENQNKNLAAFPFALGFLFVAIFYCKYFKNKSVTQ